MADELTEALIRGVQQGQAEAVAQQRTQIQRDTQARLTEAMMQRAAQADAKRQRVYPAELIQRLTSVDATPDEIAGAAAIGAGTDWEATQKFLSIGATARQKYAQEKAAQIPEDEVRALAEANPDAAKGISAGMDRRTALEIYRQGSLNQRDATGPAGKGPPLSQEQKDEALINRTIQLRDDADKRSQEKKEYWTGFATNEAGVPKAVADMLAQNGGYTLEGLAGEGEITTGVAKGLDRAEYSMRLLQLGRKAQKLMQGGMPRDQAIAQVESEATPTQKKGRWGKTTAALPEMKPAAADPAVDRVLKKLGLPDTPENRARVAALKARASGN